MFKKIQQYLLIRKPLLWNTRMIPAVIIALVLHIVFFAIGYADGNITFQSDDLYGYDSSSGIVVFFAILVGLLFFVVWLLFYLRNNAFKAFYPQQKFTLYSEFLIIFLIVLLNVTYSLTYLAGDSVRARGFYSQKEVLARCATISMASIFIDGSYSPASPSALNADGTVKVKENDYPDHSLMNKNTEYFTHESLDNSEEIVKNWMATDNKQAIRNLMSDYFKLVEEHRLSRNISAQKWFELTYNYPDFVKYERIGRRSNTAMSPSEPPIAYNNDEYSVYYLPHNALVKGYTKMCQAWASPIIETNTIYITLYITLVLALLIFSFKVTNGRSWLFAFVGMGILWILVGILSAITGSGTTFLSVFMVVCFAVRVFVSVTIAAIKGKGHSALFLNLMLWSLPGLLPLLYSLLMQYYDQSNGEMINGIYVYTNSAEYTWLDDRSETFAIINIALVILAMFPLTFMIRRWKSLAES